MEEYKPAIETMSDTVGKEQEKARQEFINNHKTEINDDDLTMIPKPKSSCKHCFGRGFEGSITTAFAGKDILLCRCMTNRVGREGIKCLTYGEFRKILDHCNSIFHLGRNYEGTTKIIQGTAEGTVIERNEESGRTSNQDS